VQTLLTHLADQEGMDLRRLGEHLALHEPWSWRPLDLAGTATRAGGINS
jgi:hypothetical protein